MKTFRHLLILLSVLTVFIAPASVSAEKSIYKAGVLDDYNFYGNNISEYARDSVNEVFQYIGNAELSYADTGIVNGLDELNNGNLDFLCMVPWNDAFSSYLDYTNEPVATGFLALFTSSESDIYYEHFEKFNNMQIGLIKNSDFEKALETYSIQNNFTYTPVYYNTISELTTAVSTNTTDAIFIPVTTKPTGMRLIAKCGNVDYYCTVKKGNSEMLSQLNNAIDSLKAESPFYLYSSFAEHFKIPYFNTAALTESEYLAVDYQKSLRILVPDDNYPMAYFDTEKNAYSGAFIDIVEDIARSANLKIEYISENDDELPLNRIAQGEIDAVLTVSGSTQGFIKASEPYTHISYVAVSKKDTTIFEDQNAHVGIVGEDDWIMDYLSTSHPRWTVFKYPSINSLFNAVEKGEIKVALVSYPDMQTKTSLIARPDLAIVNDFYISVPVSLGVSRITCTIQVSDLLDKIIKSVAVSESEFESKVYTLSHIYVPNFRDMLYTNKLWLLVVLLIFIAIIAFINIRKNYFRKLSQTDSLTKIANREYFYTNAEKILEKSPEQSYLLASIDARNFKLINDRFGRIIGDQTLANIASKIKAIFDGHGLYARSQGDSFLVLVDDVPANRRRIEKLEELDIYIHDSSRYQVPLKIGICPIRKYNPEMTISSYIDRANIAKENIPARNSNSLNYFTSEMEEELNTKNTIEIEMVQALKRNEFIVYYQPKYELETDKIIGAEALVRWNHGEKGIISPGVFIPLFEKNGFIVDLDFYVYESVFKMIRNRIINHLPVVPVSMNVSRSHLSDENFVNKLETLVSKYRVPKQYIEMEITESIFDQEEGNALMLIYQLKEHGFTVSMDDFGSGYSSLNLLRMVPIDTLKIDKVFIDNTEHSPRGRVIIEEIISMATRIHVKTICEGVETRVQRDFLKDVGCNMVQGYFYSKPLPYDEFEALLNSSN